MARQPKKTKDIKKAADRAEARSKGEEPEVKPTVIDPPEVAAKMGRPSSYKSEYATQAAKLCKLGATDADLADFFDVSTPTINAWKTKHADFFASLKGGKDESDDRVERSLYQKAVGYEYDAVKIFNNNGTPLIVPYREKLPPDTTAAIFWLKNRRQQQWRDVHKHEHGKPGDFSDLTDEQLDQIIAEELPTVAAEAVKKLRVTSKTKH